MRDQQNGRILITGSIAGYIPGTYQAVYNGTKALLDSFSFALRAELKDTGVSVTCLMPGATETEVGDSIKDPNWRTAIQAHVSKEGAVKPSDIGETIIYILAMPRRTNISEITVRPTIDTTA
jgi:NADP-dependent 3-hydroxy acid dehydrogenase YdfG